VNERLQKEMSTISRKCAKLKREKRAKYLNKIHPMLMYGTEIALKIREEPGGFTKGTKVYIYMNYNYDNSIQVGHMIA